MRSKHLSSTFHVPGAGFGFDVPGSTNANIEPEPGTRNLERRTSDTGSGFTLIELTVVLAILTAVISPSMGDYIEDARQMKAKEDTDALGVAIKRFLRDTGFKAVKFSDGTAALTKANRADVLRTDGDTPTISGAAFTSTNNITGNSINWNTATNEDSFEQHLVRNSLGTGYAVPTDAKRGRGWRGAYLNAPIGSDPWGYKYYANTAFLAVATDASGGAGEGQDYWTKDVIVVSAGADNALQAAIGGSANGGSGVAGSDDVIYVLHGNTF